MKIKVILGDITEQDTDVIVNAAGKSLLGGGGVDGAIHRAAGPGLFEECKILEGCKTGEAKITRGYNLKARFVIHTVGPRYYSEDPSLLRNCYINSLKLAEENNCKSIAFPAIGTGAYGCPIEKSVEIVKEVLEEYDSDILEEIILVLFQEEDLDVYKRVFEKELKV